MDQPRTTVHLTPSSKSYVSLDDNQGRAEVSGILSIVHVIIQSTAESKRVLNSIMTSSTMLVSIEDASGVPFDDGTGGTFHVFI